MSRGIRSEVKKMKKYIPINCDFYDEIELRALRGSTCDIVFKSKDGKEILIKGIIKNVYAKNKEEFLEMKSGEVIRLDRLVSIDGKEVPKVC